MASCFQFHTAARFVSFTQVLRDFHPCSRKLDSHGGNNQSIPYFTTIHAIQTMSYIQSAWVRDGHCTSEPLHYRSRPPIKSVLLQCVIQCVVSLNILNMIQILECVHSQLYVPLHYGRSCHNKLCSLEKIWHCLPGSEKPKNEAVISVFHI